VEFTYTAGQVSWANMYQSKIGNKPLLELLGKVDEGLQISDQNISGKLRRAFTMLNKEITHDGTVYALSQLTPLDLLDTKGVKDSLARCIYEFYANLASIEPQEQSEISEDDESTKSLSFSSQIKQFSVIDSGDRVILNISGNLIPFSKILKIVEGEDSDGVEGLRIHFKNQHKQTDGPFKGLKKGKPTSLLIFYHEIDDEEMEKLVNIYGKIKS
jgi:hypothetical protein